MYVGVDVGGTFTDIAINLNDDRNVIFFKLPSSPATPEKAIIDGLKELLKTHGASARDVIRLSHGTTVGTNALIERKCGKVALVTSQGFRDLLELGRQTRPTVYDMHSDHPFPLVDREFRYEVKQRRLASGKAHIPLDEKSVLQVGSKLSKEKIDCVVICYLHSYAFPEDEIKSAEILKGVLPSSVKILTSSSVYPEFREYERFSTAVLNAALITIISSYLDRLSSSVRNIGINSEVKICQSSGGLMSIAMAREHPVRASLSGPAAGVQGAARRATKAGFKNIITLDVGGTSADVALLTNGTPIEVNERLLAGFPIRIPALDVNAVGAGGGSIAWIDKDGLLKVGPKSSGANPGPACYGLGGIEATVTDANVFLGRLNNESLLEGRMPIKRSLAVEAIKRLAEKINLPMEETALGIIKVACATMVKAIRSISIERGHDPRNFVLFVYGGAGALHARDVAKDLGISEVIIPPCPGILCAEGAMNSFLTTEYVKTVLLPLELNELSNLREARKELNEKVEDWFYQEGIVEDQQETNWLIGVRYFGQNYELNLPVNFAREDSTFLRILREDFKKSHAKNYGFASDTEPIQIVNVYVKAVGKLDRPEVPVEKSGEFQRASFCRLVIFDEISSIETPVFKRSQLVSNQEIVGPAVIEQMDSTAVVFPGELCKIDSWGNLIIRIKA